jgi:hypothetical protein
MVWDSKHTIFAALAAIGLAGAGIAFHSWLAAHDAFLRAESTVREQQQTLGQDAKASHQIAAREKRRDARTAREITALRGQAARQKTPRQIAAWIPKQIPTPQPIEIQIPKSSAQNPAPAAALATIPLPDLVPLRDYAATCQECSLQRNAARKDLAAKDQQLKLASAELSAALKERDAALRAARGGGFWHRLGSAVKWFAIGAGAGAALLCGSGHCQ